LSATERRIVELTTEGMDALDVARRLFVTPGTVRAILAECDSAEAAPAAQVSLK
jgi:DNA-binding NarL/FixJ family response regulator